MRFIFIAALFMLLPSITDWMVDRAFQKHAEKDVPHYYTQSERRAMNELIERISKKHGMTHDEQVAAITELWGPQ